MIILNKKERINRFISKYKILGSYNLVFIVIGLLYIQPVKSKLEPIETTLKKETS